MAKDRDEQSHKFVLLVAELQTLSAALECEHYRFKTPSKFKSKQEAKKSIQSIKCTLAAVSPEEVQKGNAEGMAKPLA